MSFCVLYLYLFISISIGEAARILVAIPTPSISHQIAFRPLTRELVERGHEVVVITTDSAYPEGKTPANLTEIDIHDISYEGWGKIQQELFINKKDITNFIELFSEERFLYTSSNWYKNMKDVSELQLRHEKVQKLIKSEKFDLLLIEGCARPFLIFSHIFKAPVIIISSLATLFGERDISGSPKHPLFSPSALRLRMNNLTFFEKLRELYNYFSFVTSYQKYELGENKMLQGIFGADIPTLTELSKNVDMIFLNMNPIFEGNWPVPPNVVHLGGLQLHGRVSEKLPEDMKTFLDNSKNGVIYVSFGSNVNSLWLSKESKQTIINVFSKLPYDILWKWNADELPEPPQNIKTFKWCPQRDVLKHKKVKLFITQGGLQSTDEAIEAGVPVIGIPFFADQYFNTEQFNRLKIGIKINKETMTEELLIRHIKTVIEDKSYKENIVTLGRRFKDQAQSSLERAVWWTEYVLRNGGASHLRPRTVDMSWAEYLILDVIFTILISLILIIGILLYVFRLLYRMIKNIKLKKSKVL